MITWRARVYESREQDRKDQRNIFQRESLLALQEAVSDLIKAVYITSRIVCLRRCGRLVDGHLGNGRRRLRLAGRMRICDCRLPVHEFSKRRGETPLVIYEIRTHFSELAAKILPELY
jgi:hypothetical protein